MQIFHLFIFLSVLVFKLYAKNSEILTKNTNYSLDNNNNTFNGTYGVNYDDYNEVCSVDKLIDLNGLLS